MGSYRGLSFGVPGAGGPVGGAPEAGRPPSGADVPLGELARMETTQNSCPELKARPPALSLGSPVADLQAPGKELLEEGGSLLSRAHL